MFLRSQLRDFPGDPVVKNPPSNAGDVGSIPGDPVVKNPPSNAGDVGSIPGRGTKIPYAVGQLSLCAATTEPTHHN